MTVQQLDMFSSPEYAHLNSNVEKYKTSADNVRRGVFARLDALKKEINPRIDSLEQQLAQMQLILQKLNNTESVIIDIEQAVI
jgi:hypothetical protein